jgi:hypothetical protein
VVIEIELFESTDLSPLDFFLFVGLDEELARVLDAAAGINKGEDQLRRATRDLRTRVAKCIEVDGGIFEHLL